MLQVDNTKCQPTATQSAVNVITKVKGEWRVQSFPIQFEEGAKTFQILQKILQTEKWTELFDFDNYFDDASKDWVNVKLNKELA